MFITFSIQFFLLEYHIYNKKANKGLHAVPSNCRQNCYCFVYFIFGCLMAYRKDIRRTQSSLNATSLKIVSDDLCDRNCLKSKVSTIEELYDFLSTFCRQTKRAVFILSFISINIFPNQLCRRQPQPPHFQDALFERQFHRKHTSVLTFPHGLLLCDKECLQGQYLRATHFRQVG